MPTETGAVSFTGVQQKEEEQLRERRAALGLPPDAPRTGLAFSGGGIRSATFNLGILQGLVHRGLLPHIDYLSTVSGGGYLGSWLHGVILRFGGGDPCAVKQLLSRPEREPHRDSDEDPIQFLRDYSSYLAPSMGLLSADFWVIFVIWFRNVLLNWLVLVPFLAAITMLATILGFTRANLAATPAPVGELGAQTWQAVVLILLFMLGAVAIAGFGVGRIQRTQTDASNKPGALDRSLWASICVLLLLGSATLLACISSTVATIPRDQVLIGLFIVTFILQFTLEVSGGFFNCFARMHPNNTYWRYPLSIVLPAVGASASSGLVYLGIRWIALWDHVPNGSWHVIAWGPPMILLLWLAGAAVHIGLMGVDFEDFGREWLARIGAYVNIAAAGWLAWFALALFVPYWLAHFGLLWSKTASGLLGVWILTAVSGVLSGKSDKTSGKDTASKPSWVMELLSALAPPVFAVGLFILVASGAHVVLRALSQHACPVPATSSLPLPLSERNKVKLSVGLDGNVQATLPNLNAEVPGWLKWMEPIESGYWKVLTSTAPPVPECGYGMTSMQWAWSIALCCALLIAFMGWRIDVNEFSLHHFYKNRLVRCYLGATRGKKRRPSRLTGFDPGDDFAISSLLAKPSPEGNEAKQYLGPYAIVNGAVNLDRGSELAKQERKAENFIFTPLYCGFDPPHSAEDKRAIEKGLSNEGYRPTWNYSYPQKGPGAGTCMAISGAAASPNSGYHTSPAIAFLLTIFDVRLGWWVGNPRRDAESHRPGPRYAPYPLISELFAQTDARAAYLNISDGGHFENLAVYELVRRRCRFIIAGDGEQDGNYNFESLGGVVRKCRSDFGVDIRIDPRRIRPVDGLSPAHCVVGEIIYPDAPKGWLLYLKASLSGDEPEDVRQYQSVYDDFPQQPTPNQFFTESQFESYRKLGLHVVDSTFANLAVDATGPVDIDNIFRSLWEQWYPPSEVADGVSSGHADAYSKLLRRLSDDADLQYLLPQLMDPSGTSDIQPAPAAQSGATENKAFFFCLECLQLMENVFADVHLYSRPDRESPRNAGWIAVFHYWARQPIFTNTWNRAHYTFNPLFQQFFESLRDSKPPAKKQMTYGPMPGKE